MRALSRRSFHLRLRRGHPAKSFRLAVDVHDYDLFMDLCHAARAKGNKERAEAAAIKVKFTLCS